MTRWLALMTVTAGLLMGGKPAEAGTLTIDLDLADSSIGFGGLVVFQGGVGGSTVTGSTRLVLSGVSSLGMITAAEARGSLQSFNLMVGIQGPVTRPLPIPNASLLGSFNVMQIGTAAGVVNPILSGARLAVVSGQFANNFQAQLDCMGTGCDALVAVGIGNLPFTLNAATANRRPFGFSLTGLGSSALLTTFFNTPRLGLNLNIVGRETARQFVPEPSRSGLLLLAALLLGVASLGARLTRSRISGEAGQPS